jgi:hypothetical protein
MNQKSKFYVLIFMISLTWNKGAFAQFSDGSGWANYAYLVKIYQENLRRFIQLKEMIQQARDHDQYIRALNYGLDNAMGLAQVLPLKDDQILSQLQRYQDALKKVEEIYGIVPKGSDSELHKLHDHTIAESIKLANVLQEYSLQQEQNATNVFYQSTQASPKGAERMNAQTSAQILHSINQLIKVNGQMLKMQSESLAFSNKRDKDSTAGFNKTSDDFRGSMKRFKPNYSLPRF